MLCRKHWFYLIGNAVKFTDAGKISISATSETVGDHFVKITFLVKDTGIGIQQDKQDVLFQRFSQLDSSYTKRFAGTGLGLAISKKLVELMGGEIWFESEYGIGSCFGFSITAERIDH